MRIASVLEALDAGLLADSRCYFGGGTAIALRYGEYRESRASTCSSPMDLDMPRFANRSADQADSKP